MPTIQPGIIIRHDGKLTLATGRSRKETAWKNQDTTWSAFVGRISATYRTRESLAEYRKMTKGQQDDIKDVGGFVGGTLKEGRRNAGNVAWRQLLTLDADFAPTDFWGIFQIARDDIAAAIYSTHKHSPDKPRYRLIIPLSRPVIPDEYKALGHRIAADLGIEMFDDTTYEPERLMYWPSTSSDGQYVFQYQDGPWLDVDAELARYEDWRDPSYWPESSRVKTDRKKMADKQGNPLEKPGLIGAFCRTYTIAEAIEKFLPDIYTPTENPDRFSYTKGSSFGGLVVYDEIFAFSHHGTDPAGGKLCNAFDLVRLHLYGELDDDAKDDTPINRMPSMVAMQDFVGKDDDTKIEMTNATMAEAVARFGDPDDESQPAPKKEEGDSWKPKLTRNKNGSVAPTIENAVLLMENDSWLKGRICLNEFSQKAEIRKDLPWRKLPKVSATPCIWTDSDDSGLRFYLEKKYGYSSPTKLADAVAIALEQNRYHPVREYLDALTWDELPRLDTLLIDRIGADDTEYTRAVTRKALVAAVARVRDPGVKFDYMLTLVGGQGIGKSALLKKLGGKWYSDSLTTVEGKEAYELLQGFWILEMGELNATKRAEIEAIKLFLSKQVDVFRPAYGRHTAEYPRQCVFIGSTNDRSFLKDRTGNRRYWPVPVGHIEPRRGGWAGLQQDEIDQIWAEADQRYKAGEPLWLNTTLLEAEAIRLQETLTEESGREGIISEYLDRLVPEGWEEMSPGDRRAFLDGFDGSYGEGTEKRLRICVAEIFAECLNSDIRKVRPADVREIHEIMRRMPGWTEVGKQRFGAAYGVQRAYVRSPK